MGPCNVNHYEVARSREKVSCCRILHFEFYDYLPLVGRFWVGEIGREMVEGAQALNL